MVKLKSFGMRSLVLSLLIAAVALSGSAQNLEMGIKMYNYKKIQSAKKILEPIAATDARANFYLGLCAIESGDLTTASSLFQKFPEDNANVSGMARVAFAQNDIAKGMQLAKDLAAKAKKKEFEQLVFAADAIIYTSGGDYLQAISWDSAANKRGAKDPYLFISLGDAFRKLPGGGGNAMNNYEHAKDVDSNFSLAYSRIGDLWFDAVQYKLAVENYSKAIEKDQSNPLPNKALADAYQRSGKFEKSLEYFQKYMTLSDNTFTDKKMKADLLFLTNKYCDAVGLGKELIAAPSLPDSVIVELNGIVGFSEAKCGDSMDAVKYIRNYFRMQKQTRIRPATYIDFGKLWLKLGNLDSGSYYYSLGLKADTAHDKSDTYREIAEAFKTKKEYCKSADWYDNLIKSNPETQAQDYAWRGIMYYYCGDLGKALKATEEFENKYPTQASAMYWHGKIASLIDSNADQGTAVPIFERYLEKVGPNYEKKNELKGVYEYFITFYFNKEEKEKLETYKEKLRTIDANDRILKQIEDLEKEAKSQKGKPAPSGKKK